MTPVMIGYRSETVRDAPAIRCRAFDRILLPPSGPPCRENWTLRNAAEKRAPEGAVMRLPDQPCGPR